MRIPSRPFARLIPALLTMMSSRPSSAAAGDEGDPVAAFVRTAADVAAGYHGDVPALAQR
jgi:hypothetical protein